MFKKFKFFKYILGLILVLNSNFLFSTNYVDLKDEDIPEVKDAVEEFLKMMSPDNKNISWKCTAVFIAAKLIKAANILEKEIKDLPKNSAKYIDANRRVLEGQEIGKILLALRDVSTPLTILDSLEKYDSHPLFVLIKQDKRIASYSKMVLRDLLLQAIELNLYKCDCDGFVNDLYKHDVGRLWKKLEQNKISWEEFTKGLTNILRFFCNDNLIRALNNKSNIDGILNEFEKNKDKVYLQKIFENPNWKQIITKALAKKDL